MDTLQLVLSQFICKLGSLSACNKGIMEVVIACKQEQQKNLHFCCSQCELIGVSQFTIILVLQNGSFRGFGFADKASAMELKDRVVKAVRPYSIGTTPSPSNTEQSLAETSGRSSVVSYRSVPRRSTSKRLNNSGKQCVIAVTEVEIVFFVKENVSNWVWSVLPANELIKLLDKGLTFEICKGISLKVLTLKVEWRPARDSNCLVR